MMNKIFFVIFWAALITGSAFPLPPEVHAGSCCGGGSTVSLIVPKYARAVADSSFDMEIYDGFWNINGTRTPDPPGSNLSQYRFNVGYAHRIATNWQAGLTVPYVWNSNRYSGLTSQSDGFGDSTLGLWYEAVDDLCTWRIKSFQDMIPAVTVGVSLLIPTGTSPYHDVKSSFDVTGRGFYRIDGNILIDKTIRPWNVSLLVSYGTYLERPVNMEYGKFVTPYNKKLGDRTAGSLSLGYIYPFSSGGDTLTGTASLSYLQEADGRIDGVPDESSSFSKTAAGIALMYSSTDHDWSVRVAWNHAIRGDGWGKNFPVTDIYTVGVRYVFR
jgi:hypothetical protein